MIAKVVLQIKASFPADTLHSGFPGETSESRASQVIIAASGCRIGMRFWGGLLPWDDFGPGDGRKHDRTDSRVGQRDAECRGQYDLCDPIPGGEEIDEHEFTTSGF